MKKTLYANGKLFLIGEYSVLDGSNAFAVPTKYGQSLEIEPNKLRIINWTSYDADGSVWLQESIPLENITEPTLAEDATMLVKVLHAAHKANPAALTTGADVVAKLTFPRNWGLGSSSTFIAMVAQWFGIDAYELLAVTFGGSGYDIACALNNTPIVFALGKDKPKVTPVNFNPAFIDNLYFVYLNKKQNSREAIAAYREREFDKTVLVTQINKLIDDVITAKDLESFASGLEKQEALMGGILGIAPVQEKLFPDFKGVIKSLGGWGGDFIMAVAEENPTDYFKNKGYETIIPYKEMVL